MSVFSEAELRYLTGERHLGRLATVDPDGQPHVVPLGWTYNAELDTVDITGRNFTASRKFRNVKANPKVTLVVDDVLPPWKPRCVMVQGRGEAIDGADGEGGLIRITPTKMISFGLEADQP